MKRDALYKRSLHLCTSTAYTLAAPVRLDLVPALRQSTAGLISSGRTRLLYVIAKSRRESTIES